MNKSSVITELLGIAIEPTYFDLEHYELNPAEVIKIVKDVGANTVRLGMFSHQGHTYYPSKVAPEAPFLKGRNLLAEFEQECKKAGIRLIVYLNSKWVTDMYRTHPDWIVEFKDGPYVHEREGVLLPIYPMCPNSPFMEYFKNIVKEVVTFSHPDGIYIDNFGIELFCECRYCRKKFGQEIPDKTDLNFSKTQKYIKWMITESRKIAKDIVSACRINNPDMPVIFNRGRFWSVSGALSPEDNFEYAHKIGNMIHTESAVRFYNQSFEHINEQCVFGRSIHLPVWTWVEYPMLPFSYVPPSKEETKIKTAKVVANGGRPMVWSMPCAPFISQKGMSGITEVFKLVSQNREFFNNVTFDKFAGIIFSSKSLKVYCRGNENKLQKYKETFAGTYELMIRNHVPYDFILDGQITSDNLKNYKLLILPNVVYLDVFQCKEIEKYVANGGCLLATYETSLYNHDGKKRKDFGLRSLFGAKYVGNLGKQFEGFSAGYCRFTIEHPVNKNGLKENLFPAGGNYLVVKSEDIIANLLKRCRYYCDYPQAETAHPAIIARNYGKGKVVYVAGEFFNFYHKKGFLEYSQFFKQCVEWFVNDKLPVITDLPDSVEITVTQNKQGDKIIHLINCSFDKTRPVQEIIPIAERYLKVKTRKNYGKAVDISTGENVKFRGENDYIRISLPTLTGYNVVVLK